MLVQSHSGSYTDHSEFSRGRIEIVDSKTFSRSNFQQFKFEICPNESFKSVQTILIAKIDENAIGLLTILKPPRRNALPDTEYLGTIQVLTGWRNQEVGTALFLDAMIKAKEKGKTHLHVSVMKERTITVDEIIEMAQEHSREEIIARLQDQATGFRFFDKFQELNYISYTQLDRETSGRQVYCNLLFDLNPVSVNLVKLFEKAKQEKI